MWASPELNGKHGDRRRCLWRDQACILFLLLVEADIDVSLSVVSSFVTKVMRAEQINTLTQLWGDVMFLGTLRAVFTIFD